MAAFMITLWEPETLHGRCHISIRTTIAASVPASSLEAHLTVSCTAVSFRPKSLTLPRSSSGDCQRNRQYQRLSTSDLQIEPTQQQGLAISLLLLLSSWYNHNEFTFLRCSFSEVGHILERSSHFNICIGRLIDIGGECTNLSASSSNYCSANTQTFDRISLSPPTLPFFPLSSNDNIVVRLTQTPRATERAVSASTVMWSCRFGWCSDFQLQVQTGEVSDPFA